MKSITTDSRYKNFPPSSQRMTENGVIKYDQEFIPVIFNYKSTTGFQKRQHQANASNASCYVDKKH